MAEGPFRPRGAAGPPPPPSGEEEAAPPAGPRPEPPRPPGRVSSVAWIVGIAVVLALAYITINTIRTDAPGSRGIDAGEPLPPFAAPLVLGGPEGDAQVDPEKACGVRGPAILNSCELTEEGPAAIAFLASRSDQCDDQVDVLERVGERFGDVRLAAVSIRGERADVAAEIRKRGWELPVAWDRDGAVANLFAVAVCPTITFVNSDGLVTGTTLGTASASEIARRLQELE